MIPQTFEYTAPKTLDEALGLLAGGSEAAGRRHEPDSDDEAAPGRAGAAGGPGPAEGSELHSRSRAARFTSARPRRIMTWKARRCCAASARCWRRRRRISATCRCATRDHRRQRRACRSVGGLSGGAAGAGSEVRAEGREIGADRLGGGFLCRYVHHGARTGRDRPRGDRAGGRSGRGHQLSENGAAGQRIRDRGHRGADPEKGGKIAMARIGVTGLSNCSYRATAAEKALRRHGGVGRRDIRARRRWSRKAWTPTPICTRRPSIGGIWPRFTPRARCWRALSEGRLEDFGIVTRCRCRRSRRIAMMQDPEVLARAIPGCEGLEKTGEDEYRMKMKMAHGEPFGRV